MKQLIGNIPSEKGLIAKFRPHQGWWRTFVLNEPEGMYTDANGKCARVCNRINDGQISLKNFITPEIGEIAKYTVEKHNKKSGIIREDRLYDNLLSSQPLAFNFFGIFKDNLDLALAFLQTFRPDITKVDDVVFEYAPLTSFDHSAFDFGFIVRSDAGKGFWGFECKYTDTFSFKRKGSKVYYGDKQGDEKDMIDKNYESYYTIYDKNRNHFPDDYHTYVRNSNYNQLFRNELLAMQFKSDSEFDFSITGLFCHHDDKDALDAGYEFQKKIGNRETDFQIMTYSSYFQHIQKLELTWEQREVVMMLWARYCGLELSKSIFKES
jgi:hypothetical protein